MSDASARRALAHWGAVIATVVAVEAAVAALPEPPAPIDLGARLYPTSRVPSIDESLIQWQVDRLVHVPTDIVLFGDSSALMGLDPAVFTEATGLRAQNFGTVRWLATDGHADILELYVERHGPPQIALYHMGTGLHGLGASSIQASGSDRGQLLGAFREWTGRSVERPVPMPSLALRPLARLVLDGTDYSPVYTDAERPYGWSDTRTAVWLAEHGGMSVDHNPRPADAWDGAPAPPVNFDPDVEPGFVRMFELAEREGFPLLVAHNPIPEHYRDPERSAAYELVERRLVALAEPYPNVRIVGPYSRHVPTAAFANYEHLTPEGARQSSRQFAQLVAATLRAREAGR